ncbi:hypothetical protein FGO68_gene16397 [Halteria grandinella]|uniref:Uncharacterized protein n=1 Tax=Halteria grandinella TaxID=5974 RepID=A0A8J8P1W1_HALGN|nr:hypothetical protein FGO68_gene16397 [Halteria grandinella]
MISDTNQISTHLPFLIDSLMVNFFKFCIFQNSMLPTNSCLQNSSALTFLNQFCIILKKFPVFKLSNLRVFVFSRIYLIIAKAHSGQISYICFSFIDYFYVGTICSMIGGLEIQILWNPLMICIRFINQKSFSENNDHLKLAAFLGNIKGTSIELMFVRNDILIISSLN